MQTLLDKEVIRELLVRFCRAIDRADEGLLRTMYHPDGTDDRHGVKRTAPEYIDWLLKWLKTVKLTAHTVSNMLIDVEGDAAYGETYFHAYHRLEHEGKDYDLFVGGRYLDRFERRDGVWRIASRRVVYDWNRREPSTDDWHTGVMAGDSLRGCQGEQDPSYQ